MKRGLALIPLAVLFIAACNDSTGPLGALTGHWKATPANYPAMDFTLTQTDTLIRGSGTVNQTNPTPTTEPMVVIGFVASNSATPVALSFAVENILPAAFTGTLSADGQSVFGRFQYVGGVEDTVTFLRQ